MMIVVLFETDECNLLEFSGKVLHPFSMFFGSWCFVFVFILFFVELLILILKLIL